MSVDTDCQLWGWVSLSGVANLRNPPVNHDIHVTWVFSDNF